MNDSSFERQPDVEELFEIWTSIPVEYPPDLLEERHAELVKRVETLVIAKAGKKESGLLVHTESRMTSAMKAILGLIIVANLILATYIVIFIYQHFGQIIEILKRLLS